METLHEKITQLSGDAEKYLKTREELLELVVAEKASTVGGELFSSIVLMLIFSTVFLFLSFSAAYIIAEMSGKIYIGFISVTAFYLVAGVLLFVNREKWLKNPVTNSIIRSLLKIERHDRY